MFEKVKWEVVAHNGQKYTCIGYEKRGLFNVPIADKVDGKCISSIVYEAINGMMPRGGCNYGADRLNDKEIALLKNSGWNYDGVWIS